MRAPTWSVSRPRRSSIRIDRSSIGYPTLIIASRRASGAPDATAGRSSNLNKTMTSCHIHFYPHLPNSDRISRHFRVRLAWKGCSVRSAGPSFNSHGREAVDSPKWESSAEGAASNLVSVAQNSVGPTGLVQSDIWLLGLTAVAIECRAFGAVEHEPRDWGFGQSSM